MTVPAPTARLLQRLAAILDQSVPEAELAACCKATIRVANVISASLRTGGKLLLFGNGGSAADAQHVAAELVGRFSRDRRSLAAIALTTDSSALTAIANDFGFERIFARQVEGLARAGDVALAISTSGASPNVLAAVDAARDLGVTTVGLTGSGGGPLAAAADIAVIAPASSTAQIQECHLVIEHAICEIVDESAAASAPATSARIDWQTLLALRADWSDQGRQVVWIAGAFDVLHVGHLATLHAAKRLGDVLVVGVISDKSVRRLRGPGRPLMVAEQRAELLAELQPVDHVVILNDVTPEAAAVLLRPDVQCKVKRHGHSETPRTQGDVVEPNGGQIAYLPRIAGVSSSQMIERLRAGPQ